jgi:hypothetical protein
MYIIIIFIGSLGVLRLVSRKSSSNSEHKIRVALALVKTGHVSDPTTHQSHDLRREVAESIYLGHLPGSAQRYMYVRVLSPPPPALCHRLVVAREFRFFHSTHEVDAEDGDQPVMHGVRKAKGRCDLAAAVAVAMWATY